MAAGAQWSVSDARQQTPETRFVGSRFNSMVFRDDGTLFVWNSLSGRISSFDPARAKMIAEILAAGVDDATIPIVRYLLDRRMLVAKGADEYERFNAVATEQHSRTDLLELIILASEECDFRCTYCYETFPRSVMQPNIRTRVRKFLARRVPDIKRLSITWFGGEPLHGLEAIADIAPFAMELAKSRGVVFDSRITTNGYLLNKTTAKQLLSWGVKQFQITMDGPAEVHDSRRMLAGGGDTFGAIFNNLISLQEIDDDYKVSIRINFDKDTVEHLERFLLQIAEEFANDKRFSVRLSAVGKWGGPNDDKLNVYGVKAGKLRRLDLSRLAADFGLQPGGTLLDTCGMGSNVCYAARPYNFIVGADGSLMKCTISLGKDNRNIVGHLSDGGTPVLEHAKMSLWTNLAYQSDATCRECSLLASCQGMSCPLVRIEGGHRPCASTPKPSLAAEMFAVAELRGRTSTNQ